MALARKSSGSNVTPTTVKRKQAGAWANSGFVKRKLSGAWVTVWTAYTPISNVQHADVSKTTFGTTASGTVAVTLTDPTWSGGNPNPTIVWAVTSGSATYNPSTGVLSASSVASGQSVTGTLKVTVSDGISSASLAINYSLTYQRTA